MFSELMAFIPGGIGVPEMIIVGIIALLLFGKRLPEVARSLGKGIVEFKKGLNGIEDEVRSTSSRATSSTKSSRPEIDDHDAEVSAPKFSPPSFDREEEETHA